MKLTTMCMLASILLLVPACGDGQNGADDATRLDAESSDSSLPDTGQTPDAPDSATDTVVDTAIDGGSIAIHVAGDVAKKTYDDGLTGQTPRDYVIALSRYQILTAADDPAPVLCFDHGDSYVEADMSTDTIVGICATADIPTATYTYGQVKVEWARYTVDGVLHGVGASPVSGPFTFFRAYSDTVYEGEAYAASSGWIGFAGVRTPTTYEPFPIVPGITTELVDGAFLMTFPYNRPLPVVTDDQDARWATFHWEVFEAFRWQDGTDAGYTDGTWDVALDQVSTEPVIWAGVTGYHITTSLD